MVEDFVQARTVELCVKANNRFVLVLAGAAIIVAYQRPIYR